MAQNRSVLVKCPCVCDRVSRPRVKTVWPGASTPIVLPCARRSRRGPPRLRRFAELNRKPGRDEPPLRWRCGPSRWNRLDWRTLDSGV